MSLRVLILEDRPDDALLVAEHLRRAGLAIAWERVDTEAAFAAKLESGLDLILADYSLPQFTAPRALDMLKERDLDIPFIVVSGTVGEDAAVEVMRGGARDYVFKGNLSRLRPVIEREVRAAAERKAARAAQDEYLRRLSSIFDTALDAVITMDANGVITDWNPMAEAIFGWPKSEAVGRLVADSIIPPRYREAHRLGLARFLETGQGPVLNQRVELEGIHRDGHEFPIELSIGAAPSAHGFVFSAFARDISQRRHAEEAVRRLAATVAASTDAIISADLNGHIISWNAGAERMYGFPAADTIGRKLSVIVPEERAAELKAALDRVHKGEHIEQLETVRRRKDGRLVEVSISFAPLTDEHGTVIATTGISRDMSTAKQAALELRASEKRYRRIVETAFEGVWIIDSKNETTFVNRRMADMLGYTPEEMHGKPVLAFMDPDAQAAFVANRDRRQQEYQAEHEFRFRRKDGSELWVLLEASPDRDEAGNYVGSLAMVTDVTERRRAQKALEYQALHDALTGLPNRVQLADRLGHALESARAAHEQVAVLILDLDHFKEVNETFGHQAGDRLLEQVGPRLRSEIRPEDIVARLGGDEFAVLLAKTDATAATLT
ncbi:MAG: PAS domain S-box protein, partial [Chloroflexi bacterium]